MDLIFNGIVEAIKPLLTLDPYIFTLITLKVSGSGTLISVLFGVPFGTLLALKNFPGKHILLSIVNTGMGLPPVVVGLWVSIFLWRSGPLGFLHIIYTPTAMIIAQAILAEPVVAALTCAAIQQTSPKIRLQIQALGANRLQYIWLLLKEVRYSLLAAIIAGFGTARGWSLHGHRRQYYRTNPSSYHGDSP